MALDGSQCIHLHNISSNKLKYSSQKFQVSSSPSVPRRCCQRLSSRISWLRLGGRHMHNPMSESSYLSSVTMINWKTSVTMTNPLRNTATPSLGTMLVNNSPNNASYLLGRVGKAPEIRRESYKVASLVINEVKISYNPYEWPYKWLTGVITPISGVISPYL